ncbi:MAG: response regulator [Vicinamibacteria bacterium]|nr:response regulator [Vicinamibacteria bacterium]
MGQRVLVVDDNPANLKLLRAILRLAGYDVTTARDAEEAQVLLDQDVPRAILLDLQLPGVDGFTLARRLKAHDRFRAVPLMAVTAYAGDADERRARDAGCDDFVAKPIDTRALPERLARLLERSQ